MSLMDDIRFQFRTGNILMQLIYVNGGIFLFLMVLQLVFFLTGSESSFQRFMLYFHIPSDLLLLAKRPWTPITHMFIHLGFLHVLVNMMWLYFGGQIFLTFHNSKQLLSTFVLGGLSGALLFVLAMNVFPVFAGGTFFALGASAAVLAIMVAAATTAPNYVVQLVLLGPVKLKYIALVAVIIDVIFIPSGNAGGHFGHLGGALFGFLWSYQLKRGTDLTVDILRPWFWLKGRIPKREPPIKVVHSKRRTDAQHNMEKAARQKEVDAILDKIKQSGYDSLSKHEKEILFQASKDL